MTQMMDFFDLPAAYAVCSVIEVRLVKNPIFNLNCCLVFLLLSILINLVSSTNRNAFIPT